MNRTAISILAALALLADCAPVVQQAGRPTLGFSGPRLEDASFISFDGARLGLKHWEPGNGEPWAVIVAVHGMNDYSNAFHLPAPYWAGEGIATYAYDQRGFGRSPGRGVWAGDALMVEDLRTVTVLVRQRYPHAVIVVLGESMGGAVAIEAFASNRPPAADRLILSSPAVWGWSTQPLPYKTALWLTAHIDGRVVIDPPGFVTRNIQASDNIDELIHMGRDPLEIWGARVDALYGLVDLMQNASRDVGQVRVPTLYLAGAHDQIIPKTPTIRAAHRLQRSARSALYANGWHLLMVDREGKTVWRDIEAFVRDPRAPLPSGSPTIPGAPTPSNVPPARAAL
jgi:acylglycerol lipase